MKTNRFFQIKNFIYLVLILVLIVIDQATKVLAIGNLMGQDDVILIKGVLQLHYLENIGAAFSMLEGKQLLFLIITPIMVLIMLYILISMPKDSKFKPLEYIIVFLTAGAIGNYIDRLFNGYVVDFIYFSLINFPVFNIADCYVTVSVILLILLILFFYKDDDFELLKASILGKY